MARKRMLNSEIWRDKKVVRLSNDGFILWIAIISMADDEGIFEYDPESWFYEIARKGLTATKIKAAMAEIIAQKMVVIYGDGYGFVPAWYKHQTLSHPTPSKSKRPPKEVLDQYPEYIAAWVKTFTTYQKDDGGNRIAVAPEYPYPEADSTALDEFRKTPEDSGKLQKIPGSIDKVSLVQSSIVQSNSENTQDARASQGTSVAVFKPKIETELFTAIEQTFLSVSGKFTDPPAEINAIRTIMRYVDNSPGDAEAMLSTFLNLTRGDDDFWKRQPFTPSRLARPKIWDSVKAEARKQTESQRESLEDMERRILAKRAAKVAGI